MRIFGIGTDIVEIKRIKKSLKKKGFINLSLLGCFIGSSTVIFNKKILNTIGKFNTNFNFLTDYIFFFRCI